jgi:hypothetical protein
MKKDVESGGESEIHDVCCEFQQMWLDFGPDVFRIRRETVTIILRQNEVFFADCA